MASIYAVEACGGGHGRINQLTSVLVILMEWNDDDSRQLSCEGTVIV